MEKRWRPSAMYPIYYKKKRRVHHSDAEPALDRVLRHIRLIVRRVWKSTLFYLLRACEQKRLAWAGTVQHQCCIHRQQNWHVVTRISAWHNVSLLDVCLAHSNISQSRRRNHASHIHFFLFRAQGLASMPYVFCHSSNYSFAAASSASRSSSS